MGRHGKRKAPKPRAEKEVTEDYTPVGKVLRKCSVREEEETIPSSEVLSSLKQDVSEALKQIYTEYFNDFKARKGKRIHSKMPLEESSKYELVVDSEYCVELAHKVRQLAYYDDSHFIYRLFYDTVHLFVNKMWDEICLIPDSDYVKRLACLHESYRTLTMAAGEVRKITYAIFDPRQMFITCEEVNKLLFYERVVRGLEEALSQGKAEKSHCLLIKEVLSMEKELKQLADRLRGGGVEIEENEHVDQTDYYDISIDDLVAFINGEPKTSSGKPIKKNKKMNSQSSTAEPSVSPNRGKDPYADLEQEIEEFRQRLEQTIVPNKRLKPKLSQDWLEHLRKEIRARR